MTKILDCTLRDGGYYNKWDFDADLVQQYLEAVAQSGIDYVELGFRNFAQSGFLGAYAYTTDAFLDRINLPVGPTYGVMVDAKTILTSELGPEGAIDYLFNDASDSKVDLVRLATHFQDVRDCAAIVKRLKAMGYLVALNLMQAGGKSDDLVTETAKEISLWQDLDVLYFADSLGNMNKEEVVRLVACLRKHWHGPLGIHTHNNMGKALENILQAEAEGVEWLDVTVSGMGRGAGNAQTENLLAILCKGNDAYQPTKIYDLAIRKFEPMQRDYGWGSNILYFLGAQNDIHPTYIQNLLSDSHFSIDEIVGSIDYLSKIDNPSSYNSQVFRTALSLDSSHEVVSGSTALQNIANGRDVLILANGPSIRKYNEDIKAYISNNNPLVIAINLVSLDERYIDYYCVTHNTKFLSESNDYWQISKPVILPKHRFKEQELGCFNDDTKLMDFGLEVIADKFYVNSTSCSIPFEITAGYSFASAIAMGAERMLLVGFDGYESSDPRQIEMIDLFATIFKSEFDPEIVAITPTSYPVREMSLYAPV